MEGKNSNIVEEVAVAVVEKTSIVQEFRRLHSEEPVPPDYLCPISTEIMVDPVVASDVRALTVGKKNVLKQNLLGTNVWAKCNRGVVQVALDVSAHQPATGDQVVVPKPGREECDCWLGGAKDEEMKETWIRSL